MRRAAFPGIFFLILICLGSVPVAGASAQNQSIPPSLQPWEGWVLHGFAYRNCPFIAVGGQNQKGDFHDGMQEVGTAAAYTETSAFQRRSAPNPVTNCP